MEMMPIHPLPTQTSPRPVMPDGPLFRYIRQLQQVTGIYRWSHLRVVLYLLDNPSLSDDDCFLGTYNKIAWETGACSRILAEAMHTLQEKGLVKKIRGGVWNIHPKLMKVRNAFYRESVQGDSGAF